MRAPKDAPAVLTVSDLVRMARVERRTVLRWIEKGHERAGRLPAYDCGTVCYRRLRVRTEDWNAFCDRMLVGTPSTDPPRPRRAPKRFAY